MSEERKGNGSVKILGISVSHLQGGNTDIFQGAAREGTETLFLLLTDFDICQYRRCLSRLFKKSECGIDDQFAGFYETFRRVRGWPGFSTLSLNEDIPLDRVNFF
jgi:hypothetical protein